VGLAASVGELQLADGLIVPAGEAVGDILGELPDVVGWVCERARAGLSLKWF